MNTNLLMNKFKDLRRDLMIVLLFFRNMLFFFMNISFGRITMDLACSFTEIFAAKVVYSDIIIKMMLAGFRPWCRGPLAL